MLSVGRRNADELHAEKLKSILLNFDPPFHGQLGELPNKLLKALFIAFAYSSSSPMALHEESKWDFMDFSFLFFFGYKHSYLLKYEFYVFFLCSRLYILK